MRPTFHYRDAAPLTCSCVPGSIFKPGLPLGGGLVYNNRQQLPLPEGFQPETPAVLDGSSPNSEAAMKRARPQAKTTQSTSAEKSSATTPVETRAERLARIQREIQAGTYETTEKLELAIERMFGHLMDS